MHRWLILALVGVTLAVVALILGTAPLLPDRVATHFDWNGHANGWMSRETYVAFMLTLSVALPWIVYAATALLPGRFPRLSNLRHKAYWLAPARRDATLQSLRGFAAAIALAIAMFDLTLHLAMLEANAMQPPRLHGEAFAIVLALFVAATIGIAIAHHLRFRRPPDRAMHP